MKRKVCLIILILMASLFSAEASKYKFILNVMIVNSSFYSAPDPIYYLGYSFGKIDILAGYSANGYSYNDDNIKERNLSEVKYYGARFHFFDREGQNLSSYLFCFASDGKHEELWQKTRSSGLVDENKYTFVTSGLTYGVGAQYFFNPEQTIAINAEVGVMKVDSIGKQKGCWSSIIEDEEEKYNQSEISSYSSIGISMFF